MIVSPDRSTRPFFLLAACLLLALGCAQREAAFGQKDPLESIETIAVMGFQSVLPPGQPPGMVRNPLTGAFQYGEPVPQGVADKLTHGLFERLPPVGSCHLISPLEVKSRTPSFGGSRDLDLYVRIGESLAANAFLAGHVWRWKDRQGGELGVESPASVHFDLRLIRLRDKAIVWGYEYDKTQQSLTENLLDLKTFLRAKGRWLSAFELAELGLREVGESFPRKGE